MQTNCTLELVVKSANAANRMHIMEGWAISRQSDTNQPSADNVVQLHTHSGPTVTSNQVKFTRSELDQILRVYSFMVAGVDWRDYGISHLKDRAVFSVFRRASEMPLYRIEKNPKNAKRQGAFSVIAPTGQILKRGHELSSLLKYFDKKISLVQSS